MAYLPGVPNAGPAPVAPTFKGPTSSSGRGAPSGVAAIAQKVGKPGNTQHLGSVVGKTGAGLTGIGGGNQGAHGQGHYGKVAPPGLSGMTGGTPPKPVSEHGGTGMIKGSAGGIRTHVREGGLGPGRMSAPGPSNTNFSQQSGDSE